MRVIGSCRLSLSLSLQDVTALVADFGLARFFRGQGDEDNTMPKRRYSVQQA